MQLKGEIDMSEKKELLSISQNEIFFKTNPSDDQ